MSSSLSLALLTILLGSLASSLPAQQETPAARVAEPRRIGVFCWHDSPNDQATLDGIRIGLQKAGLRAQFIERNAGGDELLAGRMLVELGSAQCDLVFALGTQAALLAKQQLRNVPIVFAAVSNPVAAELVPTWSGTQGNLCGASNWIAPESVLAVFQLAVPGLRRLGMLRSEKDSIVSRAELTAMREHLQKPGAPPIEVFDAVVPHVDLVEPAVRELLLRDVDAIWIPIDHSVYRHLDLVQRALVGKRVPLVTTAAGALRGAPANHAAIVGAVPDYPLHGRRAASLALAILVHGKEPRELAVDRMSGCLVVANLAAARRQDFELPLSLLALADEILEPEVVDGRR